MIVEIDLEELGVIRPLNSWQFSRARKIANRQNRAIAMMAFGLGMSVAQFKKLSADDQAKVREAYLVLSSPGNI